MSRKSTTEEFIEKAKKIHGSLYDYSKTVYKGLRENVEIICNRCKKSFNQLPEVHLDTKTCPECKKLGFVFLDKAKEKFGNKFDYSKVNYKGALKKVEIVCRKHGSYWQTPSGHLISPLGGCSDCNPSHIAWTKDEFIIEAKKKHGDRYDYSKVEYKGSREKIEIICKKHGSFFQIANNHLVGRNGKGSGCLLCWHEEESTSQDDFIKQAKDTDEHFDKNYDYSKVVYKNCYTKIIIICPLHGEFKQDPHGHLLGQGCPNCRTSKGESRIMKILYENNIKFKLQQTFDGLVSPKNYPLRYDFFIPSKNILIEFDGLQHKDFKYYCELVRGIGKFTAKQLKEKFKYMKECDRRKTSYAKKHGFELIRILQADNMKEILKKVIMK